MNAHVEIDDTDIRKPVFIKLPVPIIGSKCWLLEGKGTFVLETGPGTLQAIACTHGGSGMLVAHDGVPDKDGFFPNENEVVDLATVGDEHWTRNGRQLYKANPAIMGMFQLSAGFHNGLTIRALGGTDQVHVIASIVWMPFRRRETPPTPSQPAEPMRAKPGFARA